MTQAINYYLTWIDVDNQLHCELLQPTKKKIYIGRSELADIEVLNTSVSRKHIELSWHQGCLRIKDLDSSYGTWVGNINLNNGEYKTLLVDTEIRLGNLSMWYELRRENESQEMMQTCFHPPKINDGFELSTEINDFRVKLELLLQDNFGDNKLNKLLIKNIDKELYQLITTQELRLKEQRILNSISHILNRNMSLRALLKTSLNLVSKVLNAERGFVVLRHSITEANEILAWRHFDKLHWSSDNEKPQVFSKTLVQHCFEQHKILIIGDSQLNNSLQDIVDVKQGGGCSIIVIPLLQETRVVGVIYLDNQSQSHNFNQLQIPFLTTFASHTSIALYNALLYKRAITDDLTQLFNRQYIDKKLATEIQREQRYHHSLSLLILDLDYFKRVNDTYGHTTGDLVLQIVSSIIKEYIRDCDVAGRFGGEEFI
ncbi:MAG: diguanylate cyclase, partial [Alcanivoracaceae bacterium]|nr:diguanylate cyclase [Alcanivoracaceae bacterium]